MSDLKNSESSLQDLVKTGISRREFIQRSMAAGMTVAAAESLFMSTAAAMPKRGGHVVVAITMNTVASYDPSLFGLGGEQSYGLYGSTFNCMIEVGPDRKLHGEIAESWEPSPDAKTWTFKIRKDVEFHNGKTCTSADVVASINHHRGEDTKSGAKSIVESIVDIRADGPDYVVMELDQGNADMPYLLTDYHLVICPAIGDKIDWESVIGTGGYIMSAHIPGVSMDLKRNPNYFKPDRAYFDSAQCLHIADSVAKNTALVTGSIHIIDKGAPRTLRMLEQAGGIEIDVITGTQHYTMPMHVNKAPYDNNDVRLALKHAIDREALLKIILNGHGEVGNDIPITSGNRYFNTELPQRKYDIDKAKFHLKKAGLTTLDVDLSTSETAFAGAVDTAILYKEHAAPAGINVNVIRGPEDGYWSDVWTVKPFSMCYWGGRPTEDWMFTLVYKTGASWSDTFWSNERFDSLLLQARSELNDDLRRDMYWEMQELLSNEGGTIVPLLAAFITPHSDKVTHSDEQSASYHADGWKCIERWWLA